jgi:hypothetical protein
MQAGYKQRRVNLGFWQLAIYAYLHKGFFGRRVVTYIVSCLGQRMDRTGI